MRCINCGNMNDDDAAFCAHCGHQLDSSVRKLGPYELVSELGRGAMARVWRALDPRLNREVAIKEPLFDSRLPQNVLEEMGRRFVREGVTAAQLNHPNIVTIFEADVYDGRPAIVMELVDGVTLSNLLEDGPLAPNVALDALNQLLDAVSYAHKRGVIHRDIKPDNIFVGKNGLVKLADFGIAHIEDPAATRATIAGAVLGTLGYMSPEQLRGNTVDARSDLFSVGAVAYELFTGHNPFGAGDGAEQTTIMYRTLDEQPQEIPASVARELPYDIRPVIMAALAKDPAARPQSADEFKQMLRGAVGTSHAGAVGTVTSDRISVAASRGGKKSASKWSPYVIVGTACVAILSVILVTAIGSPGGGARGVVQYPPAGEGVSVANSEGEDKNRQEEEERLRQEEEERERQEEEERLRQEKEKKKREEEEAAKLKGEYPPRFTSADASSELPDQYYEGDGYYTYHASLVLDDQSNTAWNEGVDGPGVGQWIRINATTEQQVSGLFIQNGYPLSERIYNNNNRVKDVTIELSDGYTLKATLGDTYNKRQEIRFDKGHDTLYVKITVDSVYSGSKYNDTCIAEITAY